MKAKLVIAVCTFNRPKGLESVLIELTSQIRTIKDDRRPILLVIDNSPEGSARWVTEDSRFGALIIYLHCQSQGLSNARNAGLEFAGSAASSLAFIDDDEIPNSGWVNTAIQGLRDFQGDILVGPVIPDFEPGGDNRKLPIRLWHRPHRSDKAIVEEMVGDGNVVLPKLLVASSLRYSREFNLSGGQDTDYFIRAKACGFRVRNLNGLLVKENVPLERQSLKYLKHRAEHSSCAWVRVRISHGYSKFTFTGSLVKRTSLLVFYSLYFVFSNSISAKANAALNAGMVRGTVLGLLNRSINRYTTFQIERDGNPK